MSVVKTWYWAFDALHQMQRLGFCARFAVDAAAGLGISYTWMVRWRVDFIVYATPHHPSKFYMDCMYVRLRGVRGLNADPFDGARLTGDMFQQPAHVLGQKCGWRHPRTPNKTEDGACVSADDTVFYVPAAFIESVLL